MGRKKHKRIDKRSNPQAQDLAAIPDRQRNEKRLVLAVCVILLLFGAWQSILFYGHQVVPNSDFPGFYQTGRAILSFKLPATFKRAPMTGILQNLLTPLMPGHYPDLKAGWLLNTILHPLNGVLLFLIARQLIGGAAKWFALICLLNPWVLYLMTEPIAETTLLFFILLTTWLIFKRSRWSYLAGSLATMVRYECAALIFAAFVIDMLFDKSKKERLLALGLAVLASIPLGLWMLGTVTKDGADATHYFNVFKPGSGAFSKLDKDRTGIVKHLGIIWSVGYSNIVSLPLGASEGAARALATATQILAGVTFLLGVAAAACRKNWKILVLAIFLIPYFLVHAFYPYPIPRFHVPSFWIALLISIYGVTEMFRIIARNNSAAKVLAILHVAVIVVFVFWFFSILPNLAKSGQVCPRAISLPWVALAAVVLLGVISLRLRAYRGSLREIAVVSILPVIIVSHHVPAAWLLNTGSRDAEFKELAEWYIENAQPGERLVTTMTAVVGLYLPSKYKSQLVGYQSIEANNLLEYAGAFEKKGITWVAWDSRLGFAAKDPYYEIYHLQHFKPLAQPRDHGPYKFQKQIRNNNRYINIFKLQLPPKPTSNAPL